MALFWIGIVVFITGVLIRYVYKARYYNNLGAGQTSDSHTREEGDKYRPLVFVGLGVEVIGCAISMIGIWC